MQLSGTAYHPDLGQLVSYNLTPLSEDPDTQVEQTIQRMRRNVLEDSRSAPIQRDAAILRAFGTGDPLADSFWWVKNRVRFSQDADLSAPFRGFLNRDDGVVEVLIRPADLSEMAQSGVAAEDCDGFASYVPALVIAQGGSCRFATVAADPRLPGQFSHVYAACSGPGNERISLDASHGPYPGWECTESGQVTRLKEWPIDGPDWGSLVLIAAVLYVAAKVWGVL